MKRVLALVALVLVISISLVAGTLAMYVVTIDDLPEGSVLAKEFILLEGGKNTFKKDVKIAPGETVEWVFSVRNHDGKIVSETDMGLKFRVDITKADGKEDAIKPLDVIVTDNNGHIITKTHEMEPLEFKGEFFKGKHDGKVYHVLIHWPGNDQVDMKFAGSKFGTAIKVSVTGTQMP